MMYLKFLTAYIDLTNGTLSGVGQIERYGDAEATYNTNTRKYTLAFSIQFKAITVIYLIIRSFSEIDNFITVQIPLSCSTVINWTKWLFLRNFK